LQCFELGGQALQTVRWQLIQRQQIHPLLQAGIALQLYQNALTRRCHLFTPRLLWQPVGEFGPPFAL
jgi:hypothetical protein